MIRLADYVMQKIASVTDHIFLLTGGGAMHLNDAIGRTKELKYICCHHEQSCAMAAESYARVSGKLGAINVTTGPGGINALNGVFGAWVDSIPMLVISGQVKRNTCMETTGLLGKIRQLGDQEADVITMAKGITKYAVLVDDPNKIKYHMEKAIYLALNGRPGPCWIDIPVDVQGAMIDLEKLEGYDPSEDELIFDEKIIHSEVKQLIEKIKTSKRPVIYAGSGIHHSQTYKVFFNFIETLGIPVVTAWNSNDLVPNTHSLYAGRPGIFGDRAGNFAVQNSDLVIVLGSRLNIRLVSYNWENFAPKAYKVGVDIDKAEMQKHTCTFDQTIHSDLRLFFSTFMKEVANFTFPCQKSWMGWCKERVSKYNVCLPEYWERKDYVNPYCFMDLLSDHMEEDEVIACADGTACVVSFQGIKIKKGQRLYHNSGCASMGYDLPAAIGAYYGSQDKKRIICLAGDGSIMQNLQELQTISAHKMPIQIFLLNNQGYLSIKQTQKNFFGGNMVGSTLDSGLSFPDFSKVAAAFNMGYYAVKNHDDLKSSLGNIMQSEGPFICEIFLAPEQEFSPKLSSKRLPDGQMISCSLEDMSPLLSKEELTSNMLV